MHLAMTRADVTLDATIGQCMPVGSWMTHFDRLQTKIALEYEVALTSRNACAEIMTEHVSL